jgi:serine/threonine-protein kinase
MTERAAGEAEQVASMIGQTVGGYVILDRIGAGGMGEVYLGEHRRLERRAAIKFLLPGLSKDAGLVARFFNEARALSRIQHPGIVDVFDCDVFEDRAFIVMEYLQGESLAAVVDRVGGIGDDPNSVAAVIGQIANALAAAHAKGIIHRDLKPENIFLALGRQMPFGVKILDFGIAKLAEDNFGETSHTRPGSLLGTPSYMAPEQCRGVSGIDHRVDVYALGCITFELLAGRKVFEMEAPGDLIVAHIQTQAPRLAACVPGVPAALDDLVARMLAKNPADRPQSMEEVISTLAAMLNIPAASFDRAISMTSRLMPLASGIVPPTQVMPVVQDDDAAPAKGGTSVGVPVALTTPLPRSGGVVAGSTQVLPESFETAKGRSGPATKNDSTFSRTASEILPPPKRRGKLALVAGLAVTALAATIALTSRPDRVRRGAPDEPPAPLTASPAAPSAPAKPIPSPAPPAVSPPPPADVPAAPTIAAPPATKHAAASRADEAGAAGDEAARKSSRRSKGRDQAADSAPGERLTRKDARTKDRHKTIEPAPAQASPAAATRKNPSSRYYGVGD